MLVFFAIAVLAARTVSRRLGVSAWLAFFLMLTLGGILAVTVAPQHLTGVVASPATSPASDVWAIPSAWFADEARRLNVALFVPFGFCVALAMHGRNGRGLLAGALALPFLVEGLQFAVGALHRDPQWQDVIDNLSGLLIGLAFGYVTRLLLASYPHQ
jgi:glycopeptide antibiotics resistance protein